ncbi:GIY-YIG nuclease family protein [Aerococcaceae bacterium DSM 111176]|nr:GIY-YIG nuclease family protein [Aerococcaceae bacterium DSM 111176]
MDNRIQSHYFYVLYCRDGTLYGGYTNNLTNRIQTHNDGTGAKYTRPASRRPVHAIYAERFDDKRLAMSQEYHFKKLKRPQKIAYLKENGQEDITSGRLVMVNKIKEGGIDDAETT